MPDLAGSTGASADPASKSGGRGLIDPRTMCQYAKITNSMKFLVSIYQDEDGVYIAECPSIPGCVSQGRTEAEAESNVADAIRECLAARAELGMPPTITTREVEVLV
jgi:predicted RNase H-like HicB family nuclease